MKLRFADKRREFLFEAVVSQIMDNKFIQKIALVISVTSICLCIILGFEIGLGMFIEWFKTLPKLLNGTYSLQEWVAVGYESYGLTFHLSTIATYGFLFYGLSWRLEFLNITKNKNIVWSVVLTIFNVFLFEMFYNISFAYFQVQNSQLAQLILVALLLLFISVLVISISILAKSKRKLRFKFNMPLTISILLCLFLIILWIFYPFPTETFTTTWQGETFTSKKLFPQTVYYFCFVPNDLLHLVNVLTKLMFAVTEFFIVASFKLEEKLSANFYSRRTFKSIKATIQSISY